ncbi:MAG: amidohydrolase family protein [Candidatus Firestonebacteria bacterium]|nr:amidohydrolase family protein [Candidatus Firestonebacteria bacterium]
MKRCIIRARALAMDGEPWEDKLLVINGKRIESILPSSSASRFSSRDFVGSRRYLVFPGLVDLHCHGGGGIVPTSLGGLLAAAYYHASSGTSALMLSLLYTSLEDLARMAEVVAKARVSAPLRLLGIHLEGPFLNPDARGAIPRESLRPARVAEVAQILKALGSELKIVTVAPELPGAEEVIRAFVEAGVIVALGHSLATAEQAHAAVEWGARMVTHLGNAMRPFHQREPGLVGTALSEERLTAEIIADGQHLAPETLAMFVRAKAGDLVLVSDCRWIAGLPEGAHAESGGETLEVKAGAARQEDGVLAGGVSPVWKGVATLGAMHGFTMWKAVQLASHNPAKLLGIRGLGRITVGGRADLVLAGPDFSVRRVFYGGEEIFRATDEPPLLP